jgi:hypothetical protein
MLRRATGDRFLRFLVERRLDAGAKGGDLHFEALDVFRFADIALLRGLGRVDRVAGQRWLCPMLPA